MLLLSSCNILFPAKYDNNEYLLTAMIRSHAETSIEACYDYDTTVDNVNEALYIATLLKNYAEFLPNNQQTFSMATDLHTVVLNIHDIYVNNTDITFLFCNLVWEDVVAISTAIQQVLGDKPRK